MSDKTIQLWDLATLAGPEHPVSIHTWRARIILNYLRIHSTTNWVKPGVIPEIAKSLGVEAVEKTPLGDDFYSCPFIYDPETQRYIMESYRIGRYLEETYGGPTDDKNKLGTLFPWTQEEDDAWMSEYGAKAYRTAIVPLTVVKVTGLFSLEGQAYMRASRKAWYGVTLEQIQVPDEGRAEKWQTLRAYLDSENVSPRAEAVQEEGITFRDIVLAASFKWLELGSQPGEFEELLTWKEGKWGKFYAELKKYMVVRN